MSIPMSNNIFIALHNIFVASFNTTRNWLCLNPFTYSAAVYIPRTYSGPTIMYSCVLYIPVSLYHIHTSIIIHVYIHILLGIYIVIHVFDFYDDAHKFVIRNWAMPFHWLGYIVYSYIYNWPNNIAVWPPTNSLSILYICVRILYTIVYVYNNITYYMWE